MLPNVRQSLQTGATAAAGPSKAGFKDVIRQCKAEEWRPGFDMAHTFETSGLGPVLS